MPSIRYIRGQVNGKVFSILKIERTFRPITLNQGLATKWQTTTKCCPNIPLRGKKKENDSPEVQFIEPSNPLANNIWARFGSGQYKHLFEELESGVPCVWIRTPLPAHKDLMNLARFRFNWVIDCAEDVWEGTPKLTSWGTAAQPDLLCTQSIDKDNVFLLPHHSQEEPLSLPPGIFHRGCWLRMNTPLGPLPNSESDQKKLFLQWRAGWRKNFSYVAKELLQAVPNLTVIVMAFGERTHSMFYQNWISLLVTIIEEVRPGRIKVD